MTNKKTFLKLINLFLVFAFLLTSGFGCQGVSQEAQQKMKPVTLNYWRTNDDEDAFTDIINDYETIHPNIKVVYRKFQPEEYDQELLNAFAEDRGPDLFSIPEPRLKEYQSKLLPMPATVKMAYPVVQGTIKKETVIQVRTNPTLTTRQVKDSYPDIVYKNIYINNALYGLPLSFETLVMFYNKDILNKVGIATPPTTWDEFATDVKKINRVDSGKITQSGAALGGGSNISASFDILSVLMMQQGAKIIDDNGNLTMFQNVNKGNPGLEALQFYTSFASPDKETYSWNEKMPFSLTAFAAGSVGFMFNYNYNLAAIRAQAPKLNFGIAPIPQVNADNPQNYVNYRLEVVSKKTKYSNEAWDFLLFATSQKEAKKFLDKTNRPTSLKALIKDQIENEDLNASSQQALTAQDWYEGKDFLTAEKIINDLITLVPTLGDEKLLQQAIQIALQKLSQTY